MFKYPKIYFDSVEDIKISMIYETMRRNVRGRFNYVGLLRELLAIFVEGNINKDNDVCKFLYFTCHLTLLKINKIK